MKASAAAKKSVSIGKLFRLVKKMIEGDRDYGSEMSVRLSEVRATLDAARGV